jgi:hypothetical protein
MRATRATRRRDRGCAFRRARFLLVSVNVISGTCLRLSTSILVETSTPRGMGCALVPRSLGPYTGWGYRPLREVVRK